MWRSSSFYMRQLSKLLSMVIISVALGHLFFTRGQFPALLAAITVVALFAAMVIMDFIIGVTIRYFQTYQYENEIAENNHDNDCENLNDEIKQQQLKKEVEEQQQVNDAKWHFLERLEKYNRRSIEDLQKKIKQLERHTQKNSRQIPQYALADASEAEADVKNMYEDNFKQEKSAIGGYNFNLENNLGNDNNSQLMHELNSIIPELKTHDKQSKFSTYQQNNENYLEKTYSNELKLSLLNEVEPKQEELLAKYPPDENPFLTRDIYDAVATGGINVVLQSIISIAYRRTSGYQAFVAIKDRNQKQVNQYDLDNIASSLNVRAKIDLIAIEKILHIAKEKFDQENLMPIVYEADTQIISDIDYFEQLSEIIHKYQDLATILCLQWRQKDYDKLDNLTRHSLKVLANYGIRYVLSDIFNLDIDFKNLAENKFTMVKIDSDIFLHNMPKIGAQLLAEDYNDLLDRNAIQLVISDVKDTDDADYLIAKNIQFAQGEALARAKYYDEIYPGE